MTSNDPGWLPVWLRNEAAMQPSSQYDVLQRAGLGANHPYVMRNNYWTSPASAAAVRQFPYYSKLAVIIGLLTTWYILVIIVISRVKKISPWFFSDIFSQTVGNFSPNFIRLMPILRFDLRWTTNFYSIICNFDEVMPY